MTREDKDSLVEMLAKIPVTETKGSLLSAIGRLLRVIDISESSIMIPTLLKDKCEFDAYEMLTLAKILKASILGHNDLVEFYMSESSSQMNTLAQIPLNHNTNTNNNINSNSSRSSSSGGGGSSSTSTSSSGSGSGSGNNITNTNVGAGGGGGGASSNICQAIIKHNNQPQQQIDTISNHHLHHHHHQQQPHQHQLHTQFQLLQLSATPSLRSSISGSTASSPSTHLPRAESLNSSSTGTNCGQNGSLGLGLGLGLLGQANHGDPDATVRLLLQIEQLKRFIPQVTSIFESIIELYKNSVDTYNDRL